MQEEELIKYREILNKIEKISTKTNISSNIFKICGFPHYEDVCSNILAFFFSSQKEHGLKNLFARALFDVIKIDFNEFAIFNADTQIVTDNQKRIDILVTSDDYNIIIENKIYHLPNNPLDDYYKYVKDIYGEKTIVVALGLKKLNFECEVKYKSITYTDFFNSLKKYIGTYISNINPKYSVLLYDFINNIESLIEKPMDTELLHFFKQEDILKMHNNMQKKVKELNDYLLQIVEGVSNLVKDYMSGYKSEYEFDFYSYPKSRQNNDEIYATAVSDIKKGNKTFAIDCKLTPLGWSFYGFNRQTKKLLSIEKSYNGKEVLIKDSKRFLLDETMPFNSNQEDVANKICGIIKNLVSKQKQTEK